MSQQVTHDPALGHRLSFHSTVEDGKDVMLVEMWVDPGGGVPPHVHPSMEERFDVLEGRCEFLFGRKWVEAARGESVTVPPGTRHAYRNRGSSETHVICHASPPDPGLQGFLEDAAALGRSGDLSKRGLPKRPSGLLKAAVMVEAYKDMVELGFPPLPPPTLQRLIFPALARLGERRGYRAGHFASSTA